MENTTESFFVFNNLPCYISQIHKTLNEGSIYIMEFSSEFPSTHKLIQHPMTHLKQNQIMYFNLLNLIFIFGILTSCGILSCCNRKTKRKSPIIYVEEETNTDSRDIETKEGEDQIVKAKIIKT